MLPAIRITNLGKSYRVNHAQQRAPYRTLRDSLAAAATAPFRRLRSGPQGSTEEFWALKDVNLEIAPGEVVGIIGRNGAGKSTLLKILSRITKPTTGEIEINGKVGSLLEVGTGFHPELTGRENIYMNGSILGMSRKDIERKFDEIVAFAEVDSFLDTPVKRYSSGMYVRLAFAVAAHLEPEALIIDEVLAVGDMAFQKKCLGRIERVANAGRTVLFVSHNMSAVMQICQKAILLEKGRIAFSGMAGEVTQRYLAMQRDLQDAACDLSTAARGGNCRGYARLKACRLTTSEQDSWSVPYGSMLEFEFTIDVARPLEHLELGIGLFSTSGFEIASVLSTDVIRDLNPECGRYTFLLRYQNLKLVPGTYYLGAGLRSEGRFEDYIPEAVYLEVTMTEESAKANLHLRRGAIVPEVACEFRRSQRFLATAE